MLSVKHWIARVVEAVPGQDVVIIWLPKGSAPSEADFGAGERWHDLDDAVVYAREAGRREGFDASIRCERKYLLSPEDIVHAYAQSKLRTNAKRP